MMRLVKTGLVFDCLNDLTPPAVIAQLDCAIHFADFAAMNGFYANTETAESWITRSSRAMTACGVEESHMRLVEPRSSS